MKWRAGPGFWGAYSGGTGDDVPDKKDDESEAVEPVYTYRYHELRKRGIEHREALELAERADVVHKLDRLLQKGCPPGQATRILL